MDTQCNSHKKWRTLLHKNREILTILSYLLHKLYRILGQLLIVITTVHYITAQHYSNEHKFFEMIMKDITSYN